MLAGIGGSGSGGGGGGGGKISQRAIRQVTAAGGLVPTGVKAARAANPPYPSVSDARAKRRLVAEAEAGAGAGAGAGGRPQAPPRKTPRKSRKNSTLRKRRI